MLSPPGPSQREFANENLCASAFGQCLPVASTVGPVTDFDRPTMVR